ncbi:MAG: ABC transporter permease, partial [Campylobacterales bacterium]|nr:ABC transporter permease [Campylobacterales bacterium]
MLFNTLLLALKEIRRNMMRSFLTVLGIVIGVASVIAMVILGDGTTAYIKNDISKLGSNMLTLSPGKRRMGHGSAGSNAKPFTMSDVEVLKQEASMISVVSPYSMSGITAVYSNSNHSTSIYGSDNGYFEVRDWVIEDGREFSEQEINSGKSVCIIGSTIKNELFANQNPLDEMVRLGKFGCKVVGVLKSKGSAGFRGLDQDDLVVVPIKMFQRRISGNRDVSNILLSLKDGVNSNDAKEEIASIMRQRRNLHENMDDDFHVRDMKDIIDTMTSTTKTLTYLLGSVAAISLLVGGIGIMNIMLVSVTERTREIGIRLAIGAMERDVLMQFLVEAVVLSSFGGIIGIVFGLGTAYGATIFFDIPFMMNEMIVVIAFLFSM